MLIYSWLLTLIALSVLPIQIGLTVLGAPLFRRQFRAAAEENAKTQSHLVEVLTGIQTVKAQNVEMVSRWRWQKFYSQFIARTFAQTITGTALNHQSGSSEDLSADGALDRRFLGVEWRSHPRSADRIPDYLRLRHPAFAASFDDLAKHSRTGRQF